MKEQKPSCYSNICQCDDSPFATASTEASAAYVKAVQGPRSCPDPPEVADSAGKKRCQFCLAKKDRKIHIMCCKAEIKKVIRVSAFLK